MKFLENIIDTLKYKKLRALEMKRWLGILIYASVYFSIEAYASANNIEFYIWDTALTTSIIVLTIILGNFFCGWLCFMQRFQDAIGIVGRLILRSKYNNLINQKNRNKIKWIKYILAGVTILVPLVLSSYNVFIKFWGWAFSIGMIFTLVERRAYCKYFCFIGALFKLASIKNKKILIRNQSNCTACNLCSVVCPQDCDPAKKDGSISKDLWCTSCNRCKTVCPSNAIVKEKI